MYLDESSLLIRAGDYVSSFGDSFSSSVFVHFSFYSDGMLTLIIPLCRHVWEAVFDTAKKGLRMKAESIVEH